MKKSILRLFYRLGFVHTSTIEPIFNDIQAKNKNFQKELKIKDKELELLDNSMRAVRDNLLNKENKVNVLRCSIKKLEDKLHANKADIKLLKTQLRNKYQFPVSDHTKLHQWAIDVKKTAGHKCDICNSSEKLTAHHLYSKAEHPTLMYNVDNGVCLCETCHREFHFLHQDHRSITHKTYDSFKMAKINEICNDSSYNVVLNNMQVNI